MKISEILKKDFIIENLTASTKEEALKGLCRFISEKNVIPDQEVLFQSLLEREELGSTGIGENVAIPHAKSDMIDRLIAVFVRSIEGIDFDSLDQKPVHFICLLLAPSHSTGHHLKALARVSRLLKSQTLRDGILNAKDSNQIYEVLLEEDSKFI